jgi:hypothetical protein
MKKRSQFPDAFTLSIFLKGAAEHPDPALTIPRLTQVFVSMQTSKSPIRPNHIHYNQMLNLCGRTGSMDTLWKILTTLPEHGPGAPSSQTYNIVLSALRTKLDGEELTDEERASYVQTALQIWDIVVQRWCKGVITMDSWLVAGMTGVLAASPDWRHWVGAFELVEQTTGIPKFVNVKGKKSKVSKEDEVEEFEDANENEEIDGSLFPIVANGTGPLQLVQGMELVQPTNHILQNLLYICENLRSKHAALYYWYKFTDSKQPYRCEPDGPVHKRLLGVLRLTRSSEGSLNVIKKLSGGMTQDWGVYRLALAACARNLSRDRAFDNALEIYKIRREHIALPDLKAISRFLWVLDNAHNDEKAKAAVPIIAEDTVKAISADGYGIVDPNKLSNSKAQDDARNEAAQIVTGVQGYIDRMILTKTLDAKVFSKTKPKLSKFMTEAMDKGFAPSWRSTSRKSRDGDDR